MIALALALALLGMGDDDYDLRLAATKWACQLSLNRPSFCGPLLEAAQCSHPSLEVRSRCRVPVERYWKWLAVNYRPARVPVWPDFDHVIRGGPSGEDTAVVLPGGLLLSHEEKSYWIAQATTPRASDSPPDPNENSPYWFRWRKATELFVKHQIATGEWAPWEADWWLEAMWMVELEFLRTRTEWKWAAVEWNSRSSSSLFPTK